MNCIMSNTPENPHSSSEWPPELEVHYLADIDRPAYAPTPLNPHQLIEKGTLGGGLYVVKTFKRLEEVVEESRRRLGDKFSPAVYDLVMISTASAHYVRCERNRGDIVNDGPPERAELYEKACTGAATPEELLALLHMAPELGAIDLAKLTHPFDWDATRTMDTAVNEAIARFHPNPIWISPEKARKNLEFLRPDDYHTPNGVILARRREVARIDDHLVVQKRSSIILTLTREAPTPIEVEVQKLVKKLLAQEEMLEKAAQAHNKALIQDVYESKAATLAELQPYIEDGFFHHPNWMYPTATSYYAEVLQ
jgi:hypothetical protein